MILDAFLQLALLAISLACCVLLFWLALTVALTAERRGWGLAFTSAALVLAGLFFVFHAILVSRGLDNLYVAVLSQWPLGWLFGCALTLSWYGVTLWYAGFWDKPDSHLRRRHRPLLVLAVLAGIGVAGSLLLTDPSPIHMPRLAGGTLALSAIAGRSLLSGLYPLFATGCVLLALDTLRFTVPSARPMGDIAHRRARPWLVGTSLVLLLVGLAVTGAMLTLLVSPGRGEAEYEAPATFATLLAMGDFVASGLILVGVLLLGQAVASYELFTGRALPRQGLRSNWWGAVALAFALGGTMALAVTLDLPPIFVALLGCGAASALYALYNRQTYVEHERHLATLRPLVASERTYDAIFGPASPALDAVTPFRALCGEVLGVRVAYLAAQGSLASLLGPPLAYPGEAPALPLDDLARCCDSPRSLELAVDPERYGGARWAVPLWGAQGLVGVFLLGEKADGSLFAQEELEVARAGGERLVDLLATAQMARRLAELQRSHLAETQVADQRTRRLLHDHILPELHEVLLDLSAGTDGAHAAERLAGVHRQLSNLLRDLPRTAAAPEVAKRGLAEALRLLTTEEMAAGFTAVEWNLDPQAVALADRISPLQAEVLYAAAREAMRNATRHGRGGDAERALRLWVSLHARERILAVVVEDDGVGFAASPVTAGRGTALHSTMMAVVGGSWLAERAGERTRVTLTLPVAGAG